LPKNSNQPYGTSQGMSNDNQMMRQQNMMQQQNPNMQDMRSSTMPSQDAPLAMWGWNEDKKDAPSGTDKMQSSDKMNSNNANMNKDWQRQDMQMQNDRFKRDNATPSNRMAPKSGEESSEGQLSWEDQYSPRGGRPIPNGRILNRNTNWAPRVQNSCDSPNGCRSGPR
jgi:hypothetical protein